MKSRCLNIIACFFSVLIIIGANAFRSVLNLAPCPMCQIQQLLLAAMAFLYLLAYFQRPSVHGIRYYGILTCSLSVLGMCMSGRQWWLHIHPDAMNIYSVCGSDLFYLLDTFSVREVVSMLWRSSGACEEAGVVFLYMPLPAWAFLGFGLLSVAGFTQIIHPKVE